MTNNKIPLALGYDPSTGNASGLEEFTLNLSDVGDTCTNVPGTGQALVYNSEGNWCPSTLPAPGSFTGNLSDVGEVCDNQPTPGQALVWSGNVWCPSTISTGGGGGGSNVPDPASVGQLVQSTNDTSWGAIGSATFITNSNIITTADGTLGAYATTAELGITNDTANAALPRVGGVDKNSLVITTNASAVSSLSGASGSIVYFEGTTPLAPSLKTFAQILSNENYNIAAGITYANDSTVVKTTGDQTVAGVKTFTSNPILQGIPANSVLFTNDTSSVSSTSGASGSIVCFEGTNPAPGLKTFTDLLEDVVGSLAAGDLLYVDSDGNLVRLPSGDEGDVLTIQTIEGRQYPYWNPGG